MARPGPTIFAMANRLAAWLEEPWTAGQAIVYGTLAVGVLDGLCRDRPAGLRGTTPPRLFQGIAFGLLGRDTYSGGAATALLGLALHFIVALGVVSTYLAASRVHAGAGAAAAALRPALRHRRVFRDELRRDPDVGHRARHRQLAGAVQGLLIHALVVGPLAPSRPRAPMPAVVRRTPTRSRRRGRQRARLIHSLVADHRTSPLRRDRRRQRLATRPIAAPLRWRRPGAPCRARSRPGRPRRSRGRGRDRACGPVRIPRGVLRGAPGGRTHRPRAASARRRAPALPRRRRRRRPPRDPRPRAAPSARAAAAARRPPHGRSRPPAPRARSW